MLKIWIPGTTDTGDQGLNHSSVTNTGVTIDANGKLGNCLKFNNTGNLKCSPSPFSNSTDDWSFACWVKLNAAHTGCLFSARTSANSTGITIFTASSGHIYVDDGVRWDFVPYTVLSVNTWYHICVVRKKGVGKYFYVNGVLDKSTTTTGTPTNVNTSMVSIGNSQSSATTVAGNQFNGYLNDIRVYDNALSEQEIKELAKGLILHLPLSRRGFGQDNLVKGTSTDLVIPTENTYTARSSGSNKLFTMDAKQLLLEACDKGLTLSYDIHCPGAYKNASASLNRLGCYANFSIKDNTTGETKAFYGHHSIAGTATDKNTYSKTNSLNTVSANATAENPDTSFNGHYSRTIWPKQNATVNAFYNNPDNYTVTVNQIRTEIVGVYIKEETWIKNIHLEFGDKETPWSPHSNDTIYSQMGLDDNVHKDISGYQHNTTLNNITYSTDTPFNEMCSVFNGSNSYIKVNDNTWMVNKATELTVNYWAYSSNWTSVTNGGRMISCTESGGFNTEGGSTGYLRFPRYVYTNAEQTSTAYQYSNTAIKLADLTAGWHMFTLVYNTSGEKIYIDGTLHSEASYTSYGLCFNKNARLFLGCEANTANPSSPYFNGRMSDFRIYYTALSADDVKDLYEKR